MDRERIMVISMHHEELGNIVESDHDERTRQSSECERWNYDDMHDLISGSKNHFH